MTNIISVSYVSQLGLLVLFVVVGTSALADTRWCNSTDYQCQIDSIKASFSSLEAKFVDQQKVIDTLETKLSDVVTYLEAGNLNRPFAFNGGGSNSSGNAVNNQPLDQNVRPVEVNGLQASSIARPGNPNRPVPSSNDDGDPNDWPKDCDDVYRLGANTSDIYSMYSVDLNMKFKAFCNMSNGGWTVIFRHMMGLGKVFDRTWQEYKRGFGDPHDNQPFWIGTELLHKMTYRKNYMLSIQVLHSGGLWCENDKNASKWAQYDYVRIEPEAYGYTLLVQGYTGTMGNVLDCGQTGMRHFNMKFSTKDMDNDNWWGNCADSLGFGFWHNDCGAAKFGEEEPDYLDCGTSRWHYEVQKISMQIKPIP